MFKDRAIVLLAIGQTFAWAGLFYVFPALLLRWEQSLQWDKVDLTAAITFAVLISAICSPITGRIIDAGRGPLLMAGSACLGGIGLLLLSQVTMLWQFYLVWAIIGMATSGCLYEPCFALVTRAKGKDAKRGIIFITLVAGFASTISFPTIHTLAEAYGWRSAVVLSGLMVIFVVAPLLWVGASGLEQVRLPEEPPAQTAEARNDFLKRPAFIFLALGFGLIALVHGATLQHLLPILNEHGLSAEMAVLAASFIGPMQVAGRLAMMASEKYTSHYGVAVSAFLLLGGALMLLMASGVSPVFLSGFVILFGGAYGTVSILRPLIAREVLGAHNFGAKSGALAVPYLAGAAFAPYLGSLVWGYAGYGVMLGALVAVSVIACAMLIAAHRVSGIAGSD